MMHLIRHCLFQKRQNVIIEITNSCDALTPIPIITSCVGAYFTSAMTFSNRREGPGGEKAGSNEIQISLVSMILLAQNGSQTNTFTC